MSFARATTASPHGSASYTAAQTRVIEAAQRLFAEHGISGTSLQMIADAIGVTKAAVYHQYKSKDAIVLAVAGTVLERLEVAVTAAEARSRSGAREVLIAAMIDLAVERRHMASLLQRDPVMLRVLDEHESFRRVMVRVNRVLMGGGASDPAARVKAAVFAAAIAGAVIHPLALDLDDETLRVQLLKQARKLFSR